VRNLYTVVPLRAASSKTLVEQSIGRGLRLPYGKRTGVEAVDRLTIVAHDRFQEIVDYARSRESPLRRELPQRFVQDVPLRAETVEPEAVRQAVNADAPVWEQDAARATLLVIREFENQKDSAALSKPEIQERIAERVSKLLTATGKQESLPVTEAALAQVVARTTEKFQHLTIDIPRISVTPIDGQSRYREFQLDLRSANYYPSDDDLYVQNLRDGKGITLALESGPPEIELEHYLMRGLMDRNDIPYDSTAELLFTLSAQTVAHFRSYLPDEEAVRKVIEQRHQSLVGLIHAQMQDHYEETASGFHVTLAKGFRQLNAEHYPVSEHEPVLDFRDPLDDKQTIRQAMFGGFMKCLYGRQRFDVDSERRFAVVLEKDLDVLKWYKPGRNDFQIYYGDESGYEPDFVVETKTGKFLCEPKRVADLTEKKVQAKAKAAKMWCERASTVSGKPWKYLLVPHDQIAENRTFSHFALNCVF